MHISVSGRHVDVGNALRTHIEERITNGISKYSDRVTSVSVVISKEAHLFCVHITGNTGTHSGIVIKSAGESEDVYAAFDIAVGKIEKQLRRYKRRLTNHHRKAEAALPAVQARKYVLSADAEKEAPEEDIPVVIAERATDIETLTVADAVMRMDLSDLPALLFFNSGSGRINVVYRRTDGNISWVDPVGAAEKAA